MLSEFLKLIKKNLFLITVIALISLLSFQLGRISKISGEPIRIEQGTITSESAKSTNEENRGVDKIDFRVVVSKNGSKYHFLWCSGAKRIKEENKIYFNSEQEAISAGYTLAGNCSK